MRGQRRRKARGPAGTGADVNSKDKCRKWQMFPDSEEVQQEKRDNSFYADTEKL